MLVNLIQSQVHQNKTFFSLETTVICKSIEPQVQKRKNGFFSDFC